MRNLLLIASATLLAATGIAQADEYPSFTKADANQDGTLNTQELTTALPQLNLDATKQMVTAADVKRAVPEVEFEDVDVVNEEPIGETQYERIVEAMDDMEDASSVSYI